ncbi:conserved hypothetical protein [Trichinella spiralis]|uniref:hypothetical protein n=1 Tax=Trichinella spiralis TaxID=6334 RepID=UPI0001EFEDD4|nr:conserved hypothetical protein [Trichinella spiralis]
MGCRSFLGVQALFFGAPFALWRICNFRSGFNIETIVSVARESTLKESWDDENSQTGGGKKKKGGKKQLVKWKVAKQRIISHFRLYSSEIFVRGQLQFTTVVHANSVGHWTTMDAEYFSTFTLRNWMGIDRRIS